MRKTTMAMTMPTVIIQKHSCFLGVLDKNFAIDPQICKKRDEKHGTCNTFAKTSPTNKTNLL